MTLTLIPVSDGTPGPYMDVLLTGVNVWRATIWRSHAGLPPIKVRGAVRQRVYGGAEGGLYVQDFACPYDQEVIYTVEGFHASGAPLGIVSEARAELVNTRRGWGDFHDPFNPAGMVQVEWGGPAFDSIEQQVPVTLEQPINRSNPIAFSGVRRGFSNLNLTCNTYTLEAWQALDKMLGERDRPAPPALCVRTASAVPVDGLLFVSIKNPKRAHPGAGAGVRDIVRWTLEGIEVQQPAPGLGISLPSYETINDPNKTYSDGLDDPSLTYVDLMRDGILS